MPKQECPHDLGSHSLNFNRDTDFSRFRIVPNLNRDSWSGHPSSSFQSGETHVRRQTARRVRDGSCLMEDVSSHRVPAPGRSLCQLGYLRSAVPVHGVCVALVAGEPAGHGSLSVGLSQQALSHAAAYGHQSHDAGRYIRSARLASLCRIRTGPHPQCKALVCRRQLRGEAPQHGLCVGCHHDKSRSVRVPLGPLSLDQGCDQAPYASRSPWRHPQLYPYLEWQAARCQRARLVVARSRRLLRDGPRVSRLRMTLAPRPSRKLLCHPRQTQPASTEPLLTYGRANHWAHLRPDHNARELLFQRPLSDSPATGSLQRSRDRQDTGPSDKPARVAGSDHCDAVPVSLASLSLLPMSQSSSANQPLLRHLGECGEAPNLDRGVGLCADGHHPQAPEHRHAPGHDARDFLRDRIRQALIGGSTFMYRIAPRTVGGPEPSESI